jgi:hypothetical protein
MHHEPAERQHQHTEEPGPVATVHDRSLSESRMHGDDTASRVFVVIARLRS